MRSTALLLTKWPAVKIKPIRKLEDILAGCLADDECCREWIYRSFYGYLKGVIIRYHKDPEQVEELINDSFIKIFKNLAAFSYPEDAGLLPKAFKGWIARIASRTVIDFLRIGKNQAQHEELAEFHLPVNEITVLDKMNAGDILNLLNELPQLQKVIFNMYVMEGFKHEEIAAELRIPVKNSRVYLARAKERLRILYQQQIKGARP